MTTNITPIHILEGITKILISLYHKHYIAQSTFPPVRHLNHQYRTTIRVKNKSPTYTSRIMRHPRRLQSTLVQHLCTPHTIFKTQDKPPHMMSHNHLRYHNFTHKKNQVDHPTTLMYRINNHLDHLVHHHLPHTTHKIPASPTTNHQVRPLSKLPLKSASVTPFLRRTPPPSHKSK